MAKSKQTTGAASAGAGTGNGAEGTGTGGATKTRRPTDPENVLAWGEDRDTALVQTILAAPGKYTTITLAAVLAKHPAFADDAHLLAADAGGPEKLRQRVKKLSEINIKRGRQPLALKRRTGAGYDPGEVLDRLYAGVNMATGPAPGAYVGPQFGGGGVVAGAGMTGGLIPTVG